MEWECGLQVDGVAHNIIIPPLGFVSNREHNTLRAMGYDRPVSVLRIKADMKAKYNRMSKKRLCAMITPDGKL